MTSLRAEQVKAGVIKKKFAYLFHYYTSLSLKILFIWPMLNSDFPTKILYAFEDS